MEVYLLFTWIAESPLPALVYLAVSMLAGVFCMMLAKAGIGEMLTQLRGINRGSMRALLLFGRLWIAGVLLLFPGYLTDILALFVLLFFRAQSPQQQQQKMVEARGRIRDD